MAAAWLSVIMDELRSSCVPCGAGFDSPISTLCCALQACSQTSCYTDTCTLTHPTCTIHLLNSLVYFISLIVYLLYLVPWSSVQLCVSCTLRVVFCPLYKSCLSISAGFHPPMLPPAPTSLLLLAHVFYLFPFVLLWVCLGAGGKSHFIKISMQTWFLYTLRHHTSLSRQRGHRDGEGDNQLIWSSALGNGERKRS